MQNIDPSHLPFVALLSDKAHDFVESLPALYKAIGVLLSIGGVYVGLTVQITQLVERQSAMNETMAQIRGTMLSAADQRREIMREFERSKDSLNDKIAELNRADTECKLRLDWLDNAMKKIEGGR